MNPLTRLWRGITWFFLSQQQCAWCKKVQQKKRLPLFKPILTSGICKHCAGSMVPEPRRFNLPVNFLN
jgi:hypothetical protein